MSNLWSRIAVTFVAALFPAAAFADTNVTLAAGQSLNLETGATTSSGGDLLWSGSTLTPQGKAKALNVTAFLGASYSGSAGYALLTQTLLQAGAALASSAPISGLAVNNVLGALDNSGNYAKLLVTAISGTSISFQFITYGATSLPSGPTITGVQNNYSYLVPGLPNYGIAPGTLFIITGTNLASATTVSQLQSSAAPGIPKTLNGASISVTVNGTTVQPAMYYAIATQIAAVLPSGTPVGTGTITVTYNNVASNAAPITVVQSALGLDTYYGTGSGLGVATDAVTGALITYTNSAKPGQNIVLWGSGLGADTADSDTTFASPPHAVNVPVTVYIGGTAVTPSYAGGSGYPGVNQINVTIPAGVSTGCGVAVVAVGANNVSNTMTLPIGANGGVCTDSVLGYNGTQLTTTTTQSGTYSFGSLGILQTTTPVVAGQGGLQTLADGVFEKVTYSASTTTGSVTSLGSCAVNVSSLTITTTTPPTIVGLDAGAITITGPAGTQTLTNEVIPTQTGPSGVYYLQPANSFFPPTGGSFTFTGAGGKDIGSFTASISYTSPLVWTNMSSITSVTRASGQNITWTGGAPNSFVYIGGSSSNSTASASFTCYAPASAGQFTVPSYVLLALPASTTGSLLVENAVTSTFTASGLTSGSVVSGVSFDIAATYN